ncbi:MAG: hypothetical protein H8D22_12880, partial [Candidatus Cloacimonetes bacterium]|nr:hypothetical protein [Candidatus Cloacimonadota bacterium]
MRKEKPLYIPHLTDGVNNVSRADLIGDTELHQCVNYESVEKGILTRRKDLEVYDEYLNQAISGAFYEVYYPISKPYYPMTKPSDMTGNFILFLFGNEYRDPPVYKVKAFYKISDTEWTVNELSGLYSSGVSYSSSSNVRFDIGKEMIIITDYDNNNIAHFVTVDEDGNFISGVLGMSAPSNRPTITQLTDWLSSDWELNSQNDRLCEPGLIQCLYCAVTKDGDKSNPSGFSETLDMQWFKLDTDGSDEMWVNQISIKNLSIPDVNNFIKEKLKYFDVYFRAFRYSEGLVNKPFEFSQRFEIIDKENISGETGNNYTLTVESDPSTQPSYENDIAPIAKCAKQVGGVIMLGCVKEKMKFPFNFDKFCRIDVNNTNSRTFIDGIIRIRLDESEITDLDLDYLYDNLNKIRIYDNDLTTPLMVDSLE